MTVPPIAMPPCSPPTLAVSCAEAPVFSAWTNREVKEMAGVGKELGAPMGAFVAGRVQARHAHRAPSCGGHTMQRVALSRGEEDDVIAAPRAAPAAQCGAQRLYWPAGSLDFLETAAGEKADEAAITEAIYMARRADIQLRMADDFGGKRYVLEVSSPGIERPLRNAMDWKRFVGKTAVVTSNVSGDPAGRRTDEVVIAGIEGDAGKEIVIVRNERGDERRVPIDAVEKARLAFHWKR